MRIYTLLLGALIACPMQAQTTHDWENHHVLQINREPARAAFIPFSTQKGDCSMSLDGIWKFRWTPVPDERIIDFYQANFNDKSSSCRFTIDLKNMMILPVMRCLCLHRASNQCAKQ